MKLVINFGFKTSKQSSMFTVNLSKTINKCSLLSLKWDQLGFEKFLEYNTETVSNIKKGFYT